MSPEKNQESIIIARGALTLPIREAVLRTLGAYGLETRILSEDEELVIKNKPVEVESFTEQRNNFKFSDIKSPEEFLVREHLQNSTSPLYRTNQPRTVARTFNRLVDGKGSTRNLYSYENGRWLIARSPAPFKEIIIKTRDELGIKPFSQQIFSKRNDSKNYFCSLYAVQAGSILNLAKTIDQKDRVAQTELSIMRIALRLKEQFSS